MSMTTVPFLIVVVARCALTSGAAAKKASSVRFRTSRLVSSTMRSSWPKGILIPAERAEASSRTLPRGKARCCRQRSSSCPTSPVAPTMATLYVLISLSSASDCVSMLSLPATTSSNNTPGDRHPRRHDLVQRPVAQPGPADDFVHRHHAKDPGVIRVEPVVAQDKELAFGDLGCRHAFTGNLQQVWLNNGLGR